MITIPNNLEALRRTKTQRLCRLYTLIRRDGVTLRFTDHQHTITYSGNDYRPAGGFSSTAKEKEAGLRPRDAELRGMIQDERITDNDLHAGRYNGASLSVMVVDWMYPWAGYFARHVYLLERVSFSAEYWNAEMVGLTTLLTRAKGKVVTRACGNDLGDGICRVDLDLARLTKNVGVVTDARRIFELDLSSETNPYVGGALPDGYFNGGKVVWGSAQNNNIVSEVRSHVGDVIELELQTPFDILGGDSLTIEPGCDKLRATCVDKFDNVDNHTGFPDTPGNDRMIYPVGTPA